MITVDKNRVAEKLRLNPTEHEGNIQSVIDEILPLLSLKLDEEFHNTTNVNIQSIINLGATEVVAGSYLKELANDEDEAADFTTGPIKIGENKSVQTRIKRANEWIDSGNQKLKPYFKSEDFFYFGVG